VSLMFRISAMVVHVVIVLDTVKLQLVHLSKFAQHT